MCNHSKVANLEWRMEYNTVINFFGRGLISKRIYFVFELLITLLIFAL